CGPRAPPPARPTPNRTTCPSPRRRQAPPGLRRPSRRRPPLHPPARRVLLPRPSSGSRAATSERPGLERGVWVNHTAGDLRHVGSGPSPLPGWSRGNLRWRYTKEATMRTWRVSDVMTVDVVTVREDTPYRDIVDTLHEHRVSAAPVVDAGGQVVGVVSEADLLHKIEHVGEEHERRIFVSRRYKEAQAKAHGVTARDLMSAPAVTIAPDTPLIAAAKRLDEAKV